MVKGPKSIALPSVYGENIERNRRGSRGDGSIGSQSGHKETVSEDSGR